MKLTQHGLSKKLEQRISKHLVREFYKDKQKQSNIRKALRNLLFTFALSPSCQASSCFQSVDAILRLQVELFKHCKKLRSSKSEKEFFLKMAPLLHRKREVLEVPAYLASLSAWRESFFVGANRQRFQSKLAQKMVNALLQKWPTRSLPMQLFNLKELHYYLKLDATGEACRRNLKQLCLRLAEIFSKSGHRKLLKGALRCCESEQFLVGVSADKDLVFPVLIPALGKAEQHRLLKRWGLRDRFTALDHHLRKMDPLLHKAASAHAADPTRKPPQKTSRTAMLKRLLAENRNNGTKVSPKSDTDKTTRKKKRHFYVTEILDKVQTEQGKHIATPQSNPLQEKSLQATPKPGAEEKTRKKKRHFYVVETME